MRHNLLTLDQLQSKINADEVDTVVVAFTDHYGRLLGKRADAEYFLKNIATNGSHACNYLLTTDMEMQPIQGYQFANWESGYGDFHLQPDLSTLRIADWLENTALVLCDVMDPKAHGLSAEAPRSIWHRQLKEAAELGLTCTSATELEYYVLEDEYQEAHAKNYQDLRPAGHYSEDYHILQGTRNEPLTSAIRRHLKRSGVAVEASKGEFGVGQHEINLAYGSGLESADHHVIFKQCAKEVALNFGCAITFMAKYRVDQAGSGCHLHMSLTKKGKNAFVGKKQFGTVQGAELFGWFLGGCIANVLEVMPFYAPNINSYKRFVASSWAPTRLAWSHDNRTAGFRVVGEGESLRVECRIPGADCNPYLALAAMLASGLDGIRNKTEPPKEFSGDVYQAKNLKSIPLSLRSATETFKKSAFAKQAFGQGVVDHYVHFFETEQKAFEGAVTDWELRRYFEQG